MPGVARIAALCAITGMALASFAMFPREMAAQQVTVASAQVTPTVFHWTGPDSGKVLLMVEIADLPAAVRSAASRAQVRVADGAGRMYTPYGMAVASLGEGSTLIPEYLQVPSARRAKPRYLYLVAPGVTRFVLHVPARHPVPFTASLATGAFRQ